jgi:hypothetical protein
MANHLSNRFMVNKAAVERLNGSVDEGSFMRETAT